MNIRISIGMSIRFRMQLTIGLSIGLNIGNFNPVGDYVGNGEILLFC